MQRLAHITSVELGGKAHQSQDAENKLDQWLIYAMFACSCPPDTREVRGLAATKDLYYLIFPSLKSGSEAHIVSAYGNIEIFIILRFLIVKAAESLKANCFAFILFIIIGVDKIHSVGFHYM